MNEEQKAPILLADVIREILDDMKDANAIRYEAEAFLQENLLPCADFCDLFQYGSNPWVGLDDRFTNSDLCEEYGFMVSVYLSPDNSVLLFLKEEGDDLDEDAIEEDEEYDEEEDSETHESVWEGEENED